jgi:hypothetical protein
MRYRKMVTKKKMEANRHNSKRSTGPRTERGKRASKFNALTLGLFAKHVVIASCDGDNCEKEFGSLLNHLHDEFQPIGTFEEWLVLKITECTWRLRRATRSENGAVRTAVIWDKDPEDERREGHFQRKITALTDAEEQILESGSIAQQTYTELGFTDKEVAEDTAAEKRVVVPDQALFLSEVVHRKELLEQMLDANARVSVRRHSDELAYNSLPPVDDMDRILRYEERIYRQLDWALERLSARQEMRKKFTNA